MNPVFIGTSVANPPTLRSTMGDFGHDGWPGQRIDHLEDSLLGETTLSGGHWLDGLPGGDGAEKRPPLRPDVVVVHLGTNDIVESRDPDSKYPGGYTATDDKERSRFARHLKSRLVDFLAAIHRVRPEAAFVICTIAPLGPNEPTSTDYNQLLRDDVVPKLAAAGIDVALADVEESLSTLPGSVGDDGVHPTEAGYRLMGQTIARCRRAACRTLLPPRESGPELESVQRGVHRGHQLVEGAGVARAGHARAVGPLPEPGVEVAGSAVTTALGSTPGSATASTCGPS